MTPQPAPRPLLDRIAKEAPAEPRLPEWLRRAREEQKRRGYPVAAKVLS